MMYSSLVSSTRRSGLLGRVRRTSRNRRCERLFRLGRLQGADVSDDGPTILHRNLWRVRRHRAPTIRDHVEEVAHRRLSQTIVVKRSRLAITAAHDHAVAVTAQTVTGAAKDLKALAAALHSLFRDRKRKRIHVARVGIRIRVGGSAR